MIAIKSEQEASTLTTIYQLYKWRRKEEKNPKKSKQEAIQKKSLQHSMIKFRDTKKPKNKKEKRIPGVEGERSGKGGSWGKVESSKRGKRCSSHSSSTPGAHSRWRRRTHQADPSTMLEQSPSPPPSSPPPRQETTFCSALEAPPPTDLHPHLPVYIDTAKLGVKLTTL